MWTARRISRADLTRELGLAKSTVSDLVREWIDRGVLEEGALGRSGGGRRPTALRLQAGRFALVGAQLTADRARVVVADLEGTPLSEAEVEFDVLRRPAGAIALVDSGIRGCLIDAGLSVEQVVGIGVAVPAPVSEEVPTGLWCDHLAAWEGVPLADLLVDGFGCPVFLEEDVKLGALAEAWWGLGREGGDVAWVHLAHRITVGRVASGALDSGAGGRTGQLSHLAFGGGRRRCLCGRVGCLEAEIGIDALLNRVEEALDAGSESRLDPLEPVAIDTLVLAARQRDPVVVAVLDAAAATLGRALAVVVALHDPSRVVLGGPVADALELSSVVEAFRVAAPQHPPARWPISRTALGGGGVARGAATLVLDAALSDPAWLLRT